MTSFFTSFDGITKDSYPHLLEILQYNIHFPLRTCKYKIRPNCINVKNSDWLFYLNNFDIAKYTVSACPRVSLSE